MEEKIRSAVDKALGSLGAEGVAYAVEWPTDLSHGDYATNAAMASAKALGKDPRDVAEELVTVMKAALADDVTSVSVAGPGFINITVSRDVLGTEIEQAVVEKKNWGIKKEQERPRVMIEYSNPNPFKEIHIGHLMSNVVGEAISRLIAASGAHVIRDTFGGDVGPHVAKALWALLQEGATDIGNATEIGKAYVSGATAYEDNPTAKAEIDALNTKIFEVVEKQNQSELLNEDDQKLLALWRKGRQISMEEFGRIFHLLGTSFDYIFYDSDTTTLGVQHVTEGLEKGVFERSDGAIIYRGEKKGLHTLVFITSRDNPLYPTKDIGLAYLKEERVATDEIIILTGAEQVGHFKVVIAALEDLAPVLAHKMKHLPHGLLRLTEGKMGSRKGNVITADQLIRDITEKARERNADPLVAEQVAIGAIKYMILRQAPGGDIIFDPERSLSLDGDSGPYLQYALVRARKILSYAKDEGVGEEMPEQPYDIERLIVRFPEVVARASSERAPQHLAQYLTKLAGEWNSFYASEQVLGSPEEAYKQRVAKAFAATMENGLQLLGIPTPEKM